MRNENNKRKLKNAVAEMKSGEVLAINVINCTIGCIEALKEMVVNKILAVDEETLKIYVVPEAREDCRKGKFLCPQMIYIKQ